jgi:hypothetical protein
VAPNGRIKGTLDCFTSSLSPAETGNAGEEGGNRAMPREQEGRKASRKGTPYPGRPFAVRKQRPISNSRVVRLCEEVNY